MEREVLALEGEDLELDCDVTGSPVPSVLWLKDGQVISPDLSQLDETEGARDSARYMIMKEKNLDRICLLLKCKNLQ